MVESIRRDANAPIFVVGAPRSGTTLMAKILGRHPEIAAPAPGETNFFEDIWTRRRRYGNLCHREHMVEAARRTYTLFGRYSDLETQALVDAAITPEHLVDRAMSLIQIERDGYAALYRAFTGLLAEAMGKRRFCDGTPKHLFYLDDIVRLFPDARTIICVRDPRGFLCSYKYWWRRSPDSNRIRALYHPINTSLLWNISANVIRHSWMHLPPDRLTLVHYEALVRKPEEEIRRVCTFLGLKYNAQMLDVRNPNSSFDDAQQGIFATSVDRWRTCLQAEEIWWCQRLTAENMAAFAYTPEPVEASRLAILRLLAGAPAALVRALAANRTKRGPLPGYLWRRFMGMFGQ